MTMIGIEVVGELFRSRSHCKHALSRFNRQSGLMMLLRIYALYYQQRWVVGVVAFLWLFQACMNGWLLTRGEGSCVPEVFCREL